MMSVCTSESAEDSAVDHEKCITVQQRHEARADSGDDGSSIVKHNRVNSWVVRYKPGDNP